MRNLKKFLALVLAMMMTLSLMVTVNASSTFTDEDDVADEFVEAIWVLSGMGVFRGMEDGSFKPQGNVTRAQMAAVVYRLATGDAEDVRAHLYKEYANFSDVDKSAWYAGYVGYCSDAQIIKGYGDNTFKPEKEVTGYEALAMLLRAVGYDQNKEFQGADWKVKVGATATGEKLLKNVNNSNYAGTLNQVAKREMLAEVTFQTAQIPTVTYRYGTYEKFQGLGINTLNESLGEKFYGLTHQTGIIVGNQETGETVTKLGVQGNAIYDNANSKVTGVNLSQNGSYVYATDTATTFSSTLTATNVTLNFDIESGRDYYGHKATIWYDSRSAKANQQLGNNASDLVAPGGYNKTYALLDQAKAETVYAAASTDGTVKEVNVNSANTSTAKSAGINKAANAVGFDSTKNAANIQWSAEYSQFSAIANTDDTTVSPSIVHMYTVIDNTGNGGVDAVIRLNAEVAKITETKSTSVPNTLSLLNVEGGNKTASAFTSDGKTGGAASTLITSGDDNQILPNSVTKLGEIVTVWQVKKTSATTFSGATASPANTDLFKLETLPKAVVGTVQSYVCGPTDVNSNPVVKVVVTVDGQTRTIERSGILEASKAIAYSSDSGRLGSNLRAGASYTFVLDELGRFLDITSPDTYGFIYTTYADFQDGGLGSANIDYKVYGVNWDGEKIVDRDIKTLKVLGGSDGSRVIDMFTGNTGAKSLGSGYASATQFGVAKKDFATNRVTAGTSTAFMINEQGVLSDQYGYNATAANAFDGTKAGIMGDAIQLCGKTSSGSLVANSDAWTITATDAANGFAEVENNRFASVPNTADQDSDDSDNFKYLLTTETRFIVVSGVGANMTVKEYKGIKELLGSSTSVVINSAATDNGMGGEVWFKTGDYSYDSIVTGNNRTITNVIMSEVNLKHYSAQNIYFSAPKNSITSVQLEGTVEADKINQYKLWLNGVEGTYWIQDSDTASTINGDSDNKGDARGDTTGKFYTLSKVREINGVPIYEAEAVSKTGTYKSGGICTTNVTYQYVSVNELNKATIGSDIMDVSNAIVADVEYTVVPGIATGANGRVKITDVKTLNSRVSTNSGNYAQVAIVNDGINVSVIYVLNGTTNSISGY